MPDPDHDPDTSRPSESQLEAMARDNPQALADVIATATNRVTLCIAAEAARGTTHEPLLLAVIKLCEHEASFVREGAVLGLQGSKDPRAIAALRRVADSDRHEDVRDCAAAVLRELEEDADA